MRVLIVGAGAVGQVYGRHLQAGGADVAFYVKPKYVEECRRGFALYHLRRKSERRPERFDGFGVLSSLEELASQKFDQVWLTMATDALLGDWLDPFLAAVSPAAVISLQPGVEARRWLSERLPAERLVSGAIVMISYHGPLEGEVLPEPGVCYYLPRAGSPFTGPQPVVDAIVATLRRGGCRARRHPDVPSLSAFGSAQLMPLIAGLEGAGWSLADYRRGPWLVRALAAAREAIGLVAADLGTRRPASRFLLRRPLLRFVWWAAPRLLPLDVETYLRVHFTKVRPQTVLHMRIYLEMAQRAHLETPALAGLAADVLGLAAPLTPPISDLQKSQA